MQEGEANFIWYIIQSGYTTLDDNVLSELNNLEHISSHIELKNFFLANIAKVWNCIEEFLMIVPNQYHSQVHQALLDYAHAKRIDASKEWQNNILLDFNLEPEPYIHPPGLFALKQWLADKYTKEQLLVSGPARTELLECLPYYETDDEFWPGEDKEIHSNLTQGEEDFIYL